MNVYSNPSAPQTGYNQTASVSTLAGGYNVPAASSTFNGAPSIPSFSAIQGPVIPSAVPVVPNPVPNPAAQQYIQYYQVLTLKNKIIQICLVFLVFTYFFSLKYDFSHLYLSFFNSFIIIAMVCITDGMHHRVF